MPLLQLVNKSETRKIAVGYYRLSSKQIDHDPTVEDMKRFHIQANVLRALCDKKGWLLGAVFFVVSNTQSGLQPWMTMTFELLNIKIMLFLINWN